MILERVEIVGFRGINRLSLMLEQNNVLIGENAWGKSSLLDALTLLLSPESDLYHFERDDFWFPPGDINGREHHLHIILTFRESLPGRHRVRRYRPLEACWTPCTDGYHRIFYRLEGESAEDGSVMTLRSFLDKDGHPIDVEDINDQARHLVRLMPVLRLRDARFMRRIRNGTVPNVPNVEVTARQLDFLARELSSHPQNLSDGQIRQGLSAMVQLLEHYFSEQVFQHILCRKRRMLGMIRYSGSGARHSVSCSGGFKHFNIILLISEGNTFFGKNVKIVQKFLQGGAFIYFRRNEIDPYIP